MINNTILTGANNFEGRNEMNVVTQLEMEIRNAIEAKVSQTLINGAKKTLRCVNNGSRNEESAMLAIAMLKAGERDAVIDTPERLMAFAKLLKAKEYISILSIEVKRNKFKKFEGVINSAPAPVGRAYSEYTIEDSIVVPVGISGYQTITKNSFAPFVKDFISITIYSEDDIKTLEDDGIYILFAGRDTMACMYNRRSKLWVDIRNGVEYTEQELVELSEELNGDLRLHKTFVYSPSDVRNFSFAAKDVTNGDDRDEYLNRISNGAWNKVKVKIKKMADKGESKEKIQLTILKSMPRFGQLKAGSLNLGKITSWAFLKKPFETSCGQTLDGTGFLYAPFIAERFTRILGLKVTEEAVTGMFLQARPDMQKGAYEVLDKDVFNYMLKTLKKDSDLKLYGSRTDEQPVLIVDDNVVKIESDYDINDLCLELLEIAGCSTANLSKQAFEKILYANKDAATEYAIELGQNYMSDSFARQFVNGKAKIPTIGEIKKGYVSDIVLSIAPNKILEMKSVFKSSLQNTVQSYVNSIDKLKFEIAGNNVRLTSDAAEIILGKLGRENAVIKYGEVYIPAAVDYFRRYYKELNIAEVKEKGYTGQNAMNYLKYLSAQVNDKINNTKICMVKYPSMGPKEYYLANVLTLKTIFERIDNMNLTDEEKLILKKYYKGTSNSLAKLPAVKLVMFQCAGLDYDYDGAEFIYDQKFVSILDTEENQLEATLIVNE